MTNNYEAGYSEGKISFLVELNRLKNTIIAESDFNEQVKLLGVSIINIFGMSRVVYYRPLEDEVLHAVFEFLKEDEEVTILEGKDVTSYFNPPRKIYHNERMHLAMKHGYHIRLMDSSKDSGNSYILISIKDEEGRAKGFLKIEKEIDIVGQPSEQGIPMGVERGEYFINRQQSVLSELGKVTESIFELSSFITLSAVEDPYCELNDRHYGDKSFKLLEYLVTKWKSTEVEERFRFIPDLLNILDAESVRLYSMSSGDTVKTVGLWTKGSSVPTPVFNSSFIEGKSTIIHGSSIYLANLKGYDMVIDAAGNPKRLGFKELSNTTSYIVVKLADIMNKTIGFLQTNYVFKGEVVQYKRRRKLKKDVAILLGLTPHLTRIPESEEFTHDPEPVTNALKRFIPYLGNSYRNMDRAFHYISDTLMINLDDINDQELPELIENIKKLSYFVENKRSVIAFFKWLYNAVSHKYKPHTLSAISVIFEHFTIEQSRELTVFRGDCYDTLSVWMRDEIVSVVTGDNRFDNSAEILEALLQLNCIFIARHNDEEFHRCIQYLEAMNIHDTDNTDFLFDLFTINPQMPGIFKLEIFKSFNYLIGNNLLNRVRTCEALSLGFEVLNNSYGDHPLESQVLSTFITAFNSRKDAGADIFSDYIPPSIEICRRIIGSSNNWLTSYNASMLYLSAEGLRKGNHVSLTIFSRYLTGGGNNREAILEALCNFLESSASGTTLTNMNGLIRILLNGLRHGDFHTFDSVREILLLLGNHISRYEGSKNSSRFMNLLINELSSDDINHKLAIHDILYTLKKRRLEYQSIDPGGFETTSHTSYVTAISSTLGFNPFDIGDKGYHLLEVIGQCRIPVFLLLKTKAYDDFVVHGSLAEKIYSIVERLDFNEKKGLEERIVKSGEKIGDIIKAAPLPESMQLELMDKFVKFKAHVDKFDHFVTIGARSTAKGEDGRLYSFAGQFTTILDIQTPEGFIIAIKEIWASLWSPKAISYRHDIMELDPSMKERFSFENLGMGVLIQGIVDSAASGVIMTLDSGGIVVSGSFGMEGGTRSDIAADKYTLDLHAMITDKAVSLQNSGVYWERDERKFVMKKIEPARREEQKVKDEELRILFEIVERLKKTPVFMGSPLDIEYAIAGDGAIYVTQVRPRVLSFKTPGPAKTQSHDFKGLKALKDKKLLTFTFGSARGSITIINIKDKRPGHGLEELTPGSIVVAAHLDLPNLEVYLKRRPPGAIILETCTPFAHSVLVVSEMEKKGFHIPIIQLPGAMKILGKGGEFGVEVLKENRVSFYSSDKGIIEAIDSVSSPAIYSSAPLKGETAMYGLLNTDDFEKTKAMLINKEGLNKEVLVKMNKKHKLRAFRELYLLSLYRQVEIEELLDRETAVDEENLTEWYHMILQIFYDIRPGGYELFKSTKITPFVKGSVLELIENKVRENSILLGILRSRFNDIKARNLWHPREMLFKLNAPVFIIDPLYGSPEKEHDPWNKSFNPWELSLFLAAQRSIFHDQLGTLVPYAKKNRYIRGRVSSDPGEPNAVIDLGFLDNSGAFYKTFKDRRGALSKVAAILLQFNFHPTTIVEILPRMTEDFKDHGIDSKISLKELSDFSRNST